MIIIQSIWSFSSPILFVDVRSYNQNYNPYNQKTRNPNTGTNQMDEICGMNHLLTTEVKLELFRGCIIGQMKIQSFFFNRWSEKRIRDANHCDCEHRKSESNWNRVICFDGTGHIFEEVMVEFGLSAWDSDEFLELPPNASVCISSWFRFVGSIAVFKCGDCWNLRRKRTRCNKFPVEPIQVYVVRVRVSVVWCQRNHHLWCPSQLFTS